MCGQFHQPGANRHLCHRKALSSLLVYNKSTPVVYFTTHSSYSFSGWFLLRGDTITFAFALGEQHGQLCRSDPRFLFPLSLPLVLHRQLPNPSILSWPACLSHSTPPRKHPAQSDDIFEGQMKRTSQHRQTSIRKSCVSFMRMLFCMLLYFLIIVMRCDCLLVTHNTSWGLSPGNSCQHLLIWQKATN